MNIQEIETFLTIVNAKSVSKASQQLYISQSATSQRLIALEKELGFSLIERRKGYKTIELTTKGEQFLPIAEKWYALFQDMNELSRKKTRLPLYIGAMGSINSIILTDFYKELADGIFGEEFDLRIRTNWSDELYELIDNRSIDIALVSEQYSYKNIKVEELFKEKIYLMMLKDNKYSTKKNIHPSELDISNEIFVSWSDEIDIWRNQWWPSNSPVHIYVDAPIILPYFLTDADKWAFFPSSMLNYLKSFNKFQFFTVEDGPPDRTNFLISHKTPKASRIKNMELFREYLDLYLTRRKNIFK